MSIILLAMKSTKYGISYTLPNENDGDKSEKYCEARIFFFIFCMIKVRRLNLGCDGILGTSFSFGFLNWQPYSNRSHVVRIFGAIINEMNSSGYGTVSCIESWINKWRCVHIWNSTIKRNCNVCVSTYTRTHICAHFSFDIANYFQHN